MAATELHSANVPHDPYSSLRQPAPLEPENTHIAPATPHAQTVSVGEGPLASIVDNLTLEDGVRGESENDGHKTTSGGEHSADDNNPSPSPRERLESSPIADRNDPARLDAAVDPPDLPKSAHPSISKVNDGLSPAPQIGGQGAVTMASKQQEDPATPPQDRVKDFFSLSDVPTLQTFIPNDLLPDDLFVYDPENITKTRRHKSQCTPHVPVRYVRIFPNPKGPRELFLFPDFWPELKSSHAPAMPPQPAYLNRASNESPRIAHLYLKTGNSLGKGNHSSVFSAPLRLRLDPASGEESTVRVAAKIAHDSCGAHKTLHIEAGVYDAFPRHLMEDRCAVGTPAAASGHLPPSNADSQGIVATRCVEPAVVPKFYGYYAAVASDGSLITPMHQNCGPDAHCGVSWPTRILLVEECGSPIFPELFTEDQRLHCLQLVKRLHAAGFAQKSMFVRNIVVQPGPLTAAPSARSYGTPSFRIIDFGRGVALAHILPGFRSIFATVCKAEEWYAVHNVLELCRRGPAGDWQCAQAQPQSTMDTLLSKLYEGMLWLHWADLDRRMKLICFLKSIIRKRARLLRVYMGA